MLPVALRCPPKRKAEKSRGHPSLTSPSQRHLKFEVLMGKRGTLSWAVDFGDQLTMMTFQKVLSHPNSSLWQPHGLLPCHPSRFTLVTR